MSQSVQPSEVMAQWFQFVIPVIMAVWMGAFVVQQVIKVVKGEEIEKPPVILK